MRDSAGGNYYWQNINQHQSWLISLILCVLYCLNWFFQQLYCVIFNGLYDRYIKMKMPYKTYMYILLTFWEFITLFPITNLDIIGYSFWVWRICTFTSYTFSASCVSLLLLFPCMCLRIFCQQCQVTWSNPWSSDIRPAKTPTPIPVLPKPLTHTHTLPLS